MTVGTNALLEESGARTALIATRGFADLLEIARQDRPHLYRLCAPKPAPLVDRELRFEAAERIGPEGVVEPLADGEPARLAAALRESGAESVAICLLFSYLDPDPRAPARRAPAARASRTSTSPPRTRSCPASASTSAARRRRSTPTSRRCSAATWAGSSEAAADGGLPAPLVMQSSGGVAPAAEAARAGRLERPLRPGRAARSAPGCSPAPAATATRSASTWAAPPATSAWSRTARCGGPTRARSTAARSSCRWSTSTRSAPAAARSAGAIAAARCGSARARPGAEPGPACYGRGGTEPTVTDANLLLGNLAGDSRLAGGVALDAEAAAAAVRGLGDAARPRRARDRGGDRADRQPGDGPRPARGHGRARRRPAPLRAAPLRRRRADARRRDRRRARHRADPLPARRRRPLGARALRLRPAPRHRPAR